MNEMIRYYCLEARGFYQLPKYKQTIVASTLRATLVSDEDVDSEEELEPVENIETITEEVVVPDSYIEIDEAYYQHFMIAQASLDYRIEYSADALPVIVKIEDSEQLAIAITSAISAIDTSAATVTSNWTRFAEEYKEREAAALAYKEAGYSGEVSIYITSFAEPAGITNQAAADLILKQAADLRTLQSQLAAERMRKYELKATGLTLEEITVLRNEIVANIKALGESYE